MEVTLEKSDYLLIRPGLYYVMLDSYRTVHMFKSCKLELTFSVISHGDAYGVRLPRFYNIDRIIGRPQEGGRFSVSRNRDFPRELLTLFHHSSSRRDRYPMSLFNGVTIEARVVTVSKARKKLIPEPLRYSKIAELIRVIENN